MKILFQVRANIFTERGGDTVCLERISTGLTALGTQIQIDTAGTAELRGFDCLFLMNFTLPELLRQQAEKAMQAGIPYVVLALNEDIPSFHAQSQVAGAVLMAYLNAGQPYEKLAAIYPDPWVVPPAESLDNEWVARNAALIFTTGERESRVLQRYYPGLDNLCVVPLGFDLMSQGSAAAFESEFGIKDFVLSVGRIESRKNQLMLLKALEEEDIPLVIASGGFTYQPDYDQAVRSFKRAGRTLVLGKLSESQLANAYAAARIHALPSWYELPGLVSMEAASVGKNVVVSDMGTTRDYFQSDAFYCDPGCPDSVKNAVLAAMYSPVKSSLKDRIRSFSWSRANQDFLKAIKNVIPQRIERMDLSESNERAQLQTEGSSESLALSIPEIIQKAEQIARTGDFTGALDLVMRHKQESPRSSALWRAEGMLLIALQRHKEAQNILQTALSLDPQDSRIVCGLGICARQEGQSQTAHEMFLRSLQLDRNNKIAILQLLAVSYDLDSFAALESVLRHYVAANSSELDMTYALAGCLYRQSKFDEALFYSKEILERDRAHKGALELLDLLNQKVSAIAPAKEQTINSIHMEQIFRIADLKRSHKISQGLQECSALLGNLSVNSPELEEVYSLQGELMALDGQVAEAERRFNSILVQFPDSIRAICGLGALYGEQRNWQKAEEFFRKAIAINPKCDVAFAGLALSSLHAGDKEAAWHYYEKALAVNPENLRAVFGILELGYPQARYSDIERVLKNYLELHPANLDFLYSLAGCFYAQNRLSEATQEIEKILMFSPGHSKAIELREAIGTRISRT